MSISLELIEKLKEKVKGWHGDVSFDTFPRVSAALEISMKLASH
jgi:hypothetical protein